jgi:multiple sugar transport system permease protein
MGNQLLINLKAFSRKNKNAIIFIVLLIWTLIVIFPLLWAISSSLKPTQEIFSYTIRWIPEKPTISGYVRVLTNSLMQRYLVNTVFVSAVSTFFVIVFATMAGYGFSRYKLKGKQMGLMALIACQMFPPIMFIVPYFLLLKAFAIYNTYTALILTRVVFFLPFSTLMIKSFCDSLPKELEEAAIVDGCSNFTIFIRVVLPLVVPAIATILIFTFLNSWNEFLFSITVVSRDTLRTITVGLSMMRGQYDIDWSQLMALSVVALAAPLLIFVVFQRYFIKGITAGAIKG